MGAAVNYGSEYPSRMRRDQLLTVGDLEDFKRELFAEFREIIAKLSQRNPPKKWMKSYEVRELLNISQGTLQQLRLNGTLPYTRLGKLILYDSDVIQQIMESRSSNFAGK